MHTSLKAEARHLDRLVSLVAATLAAVLLIGIPAVDFSLNLRETREHTDMEARRLAWDVAGFAARHGAGWDSPARPLGDLLATVRGFDRAEDEVELYRVLDGDGRTVAEHGDMPPAPTLAHEAPIILDGRTIGTVQVFQSLEPAMESFLIATLVAAAVAAASYMTARLLPARILHKTFSRLETAEMSLAARVQQLETTRAELEATSDDLREALEAAATASQAKSQFLANMSHELRTPLNAILGFSDVMRSETFGPLGDRRYRDYATDIHRSGDHLLRLINDILDLAKMDADGLEIHEEAMDPARVCQEAWSMVRPLAEASMVALENCPCGPLPLVRADPLRLRQVLLNLLSNAIKFTPAGGSVRLSIDIVPGRGLRLSVADTGIGMTAEEIPKALQRFRQIDSRLARKYEGTGLGLPLAKRIMELHGGSLELKSVPGSGTTAEAVLPADRLLPDSCRSGQRESAPPGRNLDRCTAPSTLNAGSGASR
ncbi:HAMP domain-containing histidine kinase [Skermanella mucosa]|uniref:sensor histidine kinase n=1 Tax=Skermanella mucosa TaxID=1789672 RepID=UPI00192B8A57|nr:HAMP domain-containing sensor histidine kinase [Skermanella mucosa]UEM21133.1 HAMP domain-containing histidine kinase [Skermanella mucosa]